MKNTAMTNETKTLSQERLALQLSVATATSPIDKAFKTMPLVVVFTLLSCK